MSIITLTTDFGVHDWFVGTMKGVIAGISPTSQVVDITHDIPPYDIRAGAFALAMSYSYFPPGTVHVAVVDPGVGSKRSAIALQTEKFLFVGPDNGVLAPIVAREKIQSVRSLENEKLFLPGISQTFHGRDVFAPVAAHLSRGVKFSQLGPVVTDIERRTWPRSRIESGRIIGEVIYIDRFGNAITNIPGDTSGWASEAGWRIGLPGRQRCELKRSYGEVSKGKAVAVVGSTGFIEIAVFGGSAASKLQLRVSDPVRMDRARY